MEYTELELFRVHFGHILEDLDYTWDEMHHRAMEFLVEFIADKKIDFGGYYNERWKDLAAKVSLDGGSYFEDFTRRDLYIYLAAMVDDDVLEAFNEVNGTFSSGGVIGVERPLITREEIEDKISELYP